MVGARKLDPYREINDKNNRKIGDWAFQIESGIAGCHICPNTRISFLKGKSMLLQHSESKKHVRNVANKSNPNVQQQSIKAAFENIVSNEKEEELTRDTRTFEIGLAQFISRHNIAPTICSCLVGILNKYITDSEIMKKMTLKREKC